jgi:hypothetical protein
MKIETIKNILEELFYHKQRDFIGITDLIRCPKIPIKDNPKVIFGNIVDSKIKEILKTLNIDTEVSKKIIYKGLEFYIHPDGVDWEERTLYEIKTTTLDLPKSIFQMNKQYLLQVYSYAKFLELSKIIFIFIAMDEIKIYVEDLSSFVSYDELLDRILEKHINQEPYIEFCETCFMKHNCEFSVIREEKIKMIERVVGEEVKKYYSSPYKLPKEGFLVWGDRKSHV